MSLRVLLCAWLALVAGFVQAEINVPQPAAPAAAPGEATVRRGGSVEIVLRAYGKANQQLRFKLRTRPTLGRISEPSHLTDETAVVIYEHGDSAEPLKDRFTYVVQSDNGVSAPATVSIKIVDDAPILIVPDEVDFKTVKPGAIGTHEITIANHGGGLVTGQLLPPENWQVQGSSSYRLDRGQSAQFTLAFHPAEEREYRADLRYSSHPDRTTTLRGMGAYPITVHPPKLVLIATPNTATRAGSVELENRTDIAQSVQITAGGRVEVPPEVTLPANGRATFPVTATTKDMLAFDDRVTLHTPQFTVEIPVHADAVGPILRTNSEPVLFTQALDESSSGEVTVENRGGTRAFVQTNVGTPFVIQPDERAFPLEPGEKRTIHLTAQPPDTRPLRARVDFGSGEIHAFAEVRAVGLSQPDATPAPALTRPVASFEIPAAPETFSSVPAITKWSVSAVTKTSAHFTWSAPADQPLRYVIELRHLSLDAHHDLQIDWLSLKDLAIEQSNHQASATLQRLNPGTLYSLRLVSIDSAGTRSQPSRVFQFSTLPKKPFPWRRLLFPGALLLLGVLLWRRFSPRDEDQSLDAA